MSRMVPLRGGWTILAAAAVLGAALASTACGGDTAEGAEVASLGGTPTTTGTTTTGATSDDPQEILLQYTACMRKEGVDLPDPDFSGGGPGGGGGGGIFRADGVDRNDPDFQAAQEKCRPILASLRQQFDPGRQEQFQDAALAFAKCMREHGIDIPDPDFSGGPPGGPRSGGPFGGASGVDPEDPAFQEAQKACQSVFEDLGGRFPGPGGGRRGGSGGGQGQ